MKKKKPPIDAEQDARKARDLQGRPAERAAQQALRESEEKFRIFFDRARDGFLVADASTKKFLYANDTICSLLGFTKEEITQLAVNDIHSSKEISHVLDEFDKLAKGEKVLAENIPVLRKDGSIFYADISAAPAVIGGLPCVLGVFRDITERTRAEALSTQRSRELATLHRFGLAISASLSLDQTLAAALRGIIEVVQPDLAYLFLREGDRLVLHEVLPTSARQQLGAIPEHLVGECMCGLTVQEGRALYSRDIFSDPRCTWEECKRAGIRSFSSLPLRGEKEIIGVIGLASLKERDFEAQADFLETLTQQISMALSNARLYEAARRELAERHRAEEAISKERVFSDHIINSLPGIFYLFDDQRKLVRWNKKYEKVTGYSSEELFGMHPDDFFTEEYKGYMISRVQSVFAEGEAFAEALFLAKSGEQTPYFFTGRLTVLEGRRYLLGVGIDISDRKRAEEALKNSEKEFRSLAESMPQIVWITRPDGWNIYFNQQWVDYTGQTLEESHGHGWNKPFHPDDRQRAWDAWQNAIKHDSTYSLECRLRRADGAYKWWLIRGVPVMDAHGAVLKWFGTCTDINDIKMAEVEKEKLQAQLLQAQKMESVGRLAGGVAHDFNNMLGVILGHTELALQQIGPAEPLRNNLEEIRKAGQRAADLTRQLLAFARKQIVAPQVLKLNDLVANMLSMLRRLIGENIELAWLPGEDLWPVKMDPSQVDQILANLCVNARDACVEVGKVTIATRNVSLDEGYCAIHTGFIPGEYVQLTVSDSGCGMEKEVLANVFEPFFTTKGTGKGTGLGLSTVYGIVKQNRGFINVYSEPGAGTTFKIYLPRSLDTLELVPEGGRPLEIAGGTETILLVEDEPALLNMGREMLENFGYRVLAAGTPKEALQLAEKHAGEIDLLVTDVVMPGMTGWDLSKRLLSLDPNLKRLFMSGYAADIVADHGLLEEGMTFLQKPFSPKNLSLKVREALGKKE